MPYWGFNPHGVMIVRGEKFAGNSLVEQIDAPGTHRERALGEFGGDPEIVAGGTLPPPAIVHDALRHKIGEAARTRYKYRSAASRSPIARAQNKAPVAAGHAPVADIAREQTGIRSSSCRAGACAQWRRGPRRSTRQRRDGIVSDGHSLKVAALLWVAHAGAGQGGRITRFFIREPAQKQRDFLGVFRVAGELPRHRSLRKPPRKQDSRTRTDGPRDRPPAGPAWTPRAPAIRRRLSHTAPARALPNRISSPSRAPPPNPTL